MKARTIISGVRDVMRSGLQSKVKLTINLLLKVLTKIILPSSYFLRLIKFTFLS